MIATLVEYNADGTLNTDFGNNGLLLSTPGPNAYEFADIGTLPDGKIIAIGSLDYDGQYDFLAARFLADGTPDEDFAENGFFSTDYESISDHAGSLVIQPDQKIVLTGYHGIWPTSSFALLRLDENGAPDNTYGDEGLTLTSFFGGFDYAVCSTLQPDGKLIVGGTAGQGSDYMLGMARYTTGITVGIAENYQNKISTKIFPNPISNNANLSFKLQSEGKVSVNLIDLSGREIKTYANKKQYKKGQHQFTLDISDVKPGIYFLNVSTEDHSQILKLVKQ